MIREAAAADLQAILAVERAAFGGESEAGLVAALLDDPSAAPLLSLVAEREQALIGHVLFTQVRIGPMPAPLNAMILAPLAVVPVAQGLGIGSALVRTGLARLERSGVQLVFVLGDPEYYGRFGFEPAGPLGLEPPYALPAAWT